MPFCAVELSAAVVILRCQRRSLSLSAWWYPAAKSLRLVSVLALLSGLLLPSATRFLTWTASSDAPPPGRFLGQRPICGVRSRLTALLISPKV